ncbi:MAG TPA: HAD-IA family hydrolase [Actinomycetota bacterium]|nr:HAD-IA family hydrolase [Actinomycetota bacterium]
MGGGWGGRGSLEVVFLDVGGVLYRDDRYVESLRRALRELGARFTDQEFDAAYAECRAAQAGSFRRHLTARFLGPEADPGEVERRAARWWRYGPDELYPDARPAVEALRAAGYRLGLIANQPSHVAEALRRDGLEDAFELRLVSEDVGLEKPDPRLFARALELAAVPPGRAAMVGDRLDRDVRPARAAGMRAVWVLRGEAPDAPTVDQLEEADAAIASLRELPAALEVL